VVKKGGRNNKENPIMDQAQANLLLELFLAFQRQGVYDGSFTSALRKVEDVLLPSACLIFIRGSFEELLKKSVSNAQSNLMEVYKKTVRLSWQSFLPNSGLTNVSFLQSGTQCEVYLASLGTTPCVLKCFFRVQGYGCYESYEFQVHCYLRSLRCNVPQYWGFVLTPHFRCYLIRRLEQTLLSKLQSQSCGLGMKEAIRIGLGVVPILKKLHSYGFLYLDISVGNVGYEGEKVFLFDFGAARPIMIMDDEPVCFYTPRYASRHTVDGIAPTTADDFEALGFLMLDVYGTSSFPFSATYTRQQKQGVIDGVMSQATKFDSFFAQYFAVVEDETLKEDLCDPLMKLLRSSWNEWQ